MATPTEHAKHSPSSLRYKELCPGWQKTELAGEAAAEGTAMHHAAETGDMTGLTEEQRAQVQECLDYIKPLVADAQEVHRELKLDVAGLTRGTADLLAIYPETAHVVDFKFGRWPVDDAEINLQGWAYAVGAFTRFPVEQVTVHFLMPRLDEATRHTFRRSELPRMIERIETVIARAEEPEPQLNPDPKACQYCAAKGRCPALAAKALMIPRNMHWDLPAELDPAAITSPAAMSKVMQIVPLIESWASEIKARALDMARQGDEIPGYTLRHRSGKRVVKDLLPAWSILNEEFGVELDEFLPACSVSIGAIEDAVKAKAQKGEGANLLRQLNTRFAQEGIVTTAPDIEYLAKNKTKD